MRWPRKRYAEPGEAVTAQDRLQLKRLEAELAERHRHVDALAEETQQQARYLRRERERNHIAARFRAALQGR